MLVNCKYSANKMATYQPTSRGFICATIRIKGYKPLSKTHRTKKLAQQWAQPIEDQMRSGTYHKLKDADLSIIFDKYVKQIVPLKKTTRFHEQNIRTLNKYFGGMSFKSVLASDVVDYVTKRLEAVKTSTVRKEINTMSNVYNTAIALWGYELTVNPVSQAKTVLKNTRALRQPPARNRRLSEGEEGKLLKSLSDAPQPMLVAILTLETARRLSEILAITPDMIQTRGGTAFMRVIDNKTGDNLSVPLTEKAASLLDGFDGFTIKSGSASQAMRRAVKRAGLVDLTINDLRHEALSRLFERDFDVAEVMSISGHKSAEILLKIYTQVKGERVSLKLSQPR